ncbi:protein ApaG [Thalassotalea insulae]|uniref:Protein ApaG n=1 Tax=Thalassotalea insulae TaxID=2056778 RepID=A0ABQ6GY52_9GAMM|nr:Co2+/Mg2+ efflux protein ApaG [Thalassotalea insulae]GLX79131.1 protein ApaG [Thalassotalea insulae]
MNDDFNVSVTTAFIPQQSNEREQRYTFSYTITITNHGSKSAQLLSRYWLITDANDDKSTVVGEGVVGQQPVIAPGEHFEYTSGCILKTPVGTMEGHYQFIDPDKQMFDVAIPVFRLAQPNILN